MLNAMKGKRLNLWMPEGWDEKIKDLMDYLESQGVDLRDKNRDTLSQSALFRYLVKSNLKELGKWTPDDDKLK